MTKIAVSLLVFRRRNLSISILIICLKRTLTETSFVEHTKRILIKNFSWQMNSPHKHGVLIVAKRHRHPYHSWLRASSVFEVERFLQLAHR